MLSVEDRYYNINRTLLKLVGLWPYQNAKWTRVMAIIITSLFLSAIFVQLAVFITHECTLDIILKVLSFVFPTMFMLFMYNMYYFKIDAIKNIMEYIYYDWKSLKNEVELNIMSDQAYIAKLFTQVFTFFLIIGLFLTVMSHAVPMTLDIISPLNETRGEHIHIIVEYFVDWSEYYYWSILHLTIFICVGCVTIVATALAMFNYGLHACALFKVANYRMKVTMDKNVLRISSPEMEHIIHERIICAVDFHRRAIQFVYEIFQKPYYDLLLSSFQRWFLFVIIVGVISLSINLFRLMKAITAYDAFVELIIPTALVFSHFCFLFFSNHVGQQLTNNNAEIFSTVYNLPWYIAPLNIQRLVLFLLQKGNKDMYLSVSGVFDASYEGFTALSTSSISYFTVIYAIQ